MPTLYNIFQRYEFESIRTRIEFVMGVGIAAVVRKIHVRHQGEGHIRPCRSGLSCDRSGLSCDRFGLSCDRSELSCDRSGLSCDRFGLSCDRFG